ncbi:hypothetical protein STCU_06136 [Strigomonas culicis]|uniref:Exonuclease domain-containing protein n=1 Tax=Strigomonas culicis TaxID=28005 RepID=S9VTX8_9TRYP|nr:hypothetical protein STCU_06136 [Strigomonas culicis]|eukprot:EPY26675.1 hypothetical protein STCU_06136 [Strigomonas culicis]
MRRNVFRYAISAASKASGLTPLEAFTQIQLGIVPPLSVQRSFLMDYCASQLTARGITEAQLFAMDGKYCNQLVRQVVYERYLAVPFRVYAFDMEFTGPPVFTADGPTEDITEFGLYSPARDELFSCLVRPVCGRKLGPGVAELTHITDELLEEEGLPFEEAWQLFLDFVQKPEPGEMPGAGDRILLLSHGGKLADQSLIKWTLEKHHLTLPSSFVFGDTINIIREAHRKRPVTVDKHPPSWKLGDLVQWLKIPTLSAHRAGNDARMTWDAIYHTLLRYGDDALTPREQLVSRFFDDEAKRRMREECRSGQRASVLAEEEGFMMESSGLGGGESGALDVDFDEIFKVGSAAHAATEDRREGRAGTGVGTHGMTDADATGSIPEFTLDESEDDAAEDNGKKEKGRAKGTGTAHPTTEPNAMPRVRTRQAAPARRSRAKKKQVIKIRQSHQSP